jgi:DNA (cytosine-5)-methyltransferase 1
MPTTRRTITCLELCAGAGGQAIGLERAGFEHSALVEIDGDCCATLKLNRPVWNVIQSDLRDFDPAPYKGVDLVAGGLPCPPFSVAGKQLGKADERNLFPEAIRIIEQCQPKAVMIENVRGILDAVFDDYRNHVEKQLERLGYKPEWRMFNSADFGVPQLRPRVLFVAVKKNLYRHFAWPLGGFVMPPTVGEVLRDLIAENGWKGARDWSRRANEIAPTIVGGSRKHGGPDLGPTRARQAWASLGVDGKGVWDSAPARDFVGMPRLTVRMVALLQGFPPEWQFSGRKTSAYRQVGNAFPPPVAHAIAGQIGKCLALRKVMRMAG